MMLRSGGPLSRIAVAVALAAPSLAAAPPGEPIRDQITVELVNVEVHVTDRDGRPVAGLTRDDFQLTDGGRPAEITHFAWVPAMDAQRAAGGDGGEAAPAQPRQLAIFFDEMQVSERSRAPVLRALTAQLDHLLRPGDRVSVVRFDGADIELVQAWTGDRRKIDRALGELGGFSVRRLAAGQDLRSFMRLLEDDIKGGPAKKQSGGCPDAGVILRSYADLVRRNVESSASALLRYAQRLAHEPGQRLLVHVSDGIPMIAGGEAYQYAIDMCSGEAVAQGVSGAFSVLSDGDGQDETRDRFDPFKARLEMSEYVMAPLWHDVAARVNALGVTIYPVQSSDPAAQFLPTLEMNVVPAAVQSMARQNPVDTLALLADETGGLLIRADRGADDEIGRLARDLGGYYSLAFTPAPSERPELRRLRVEVDRPGLRLRYRQSYRLSSRDERIASQLAELFEADHVDNPLGIGVHLVTAAAAGRDRVRVTVPLARLSLVESAAQKEAREGLFVVYVTLQKRSGGVYVPRRREVPVTVRSGEGASYTYDVELPANFGDVGVAVLDEFSGEVSFARLRAPSR